MDKSPVFSWAQSQTIVGAMNPNENIKSAILEKALKEVVFDGWSMQSLEQAALSAGYAKEMASAVFPRGVEDALVYFSAWADAKMMTALAGIKPETLRVRDRISTAVKARLDVLSAYKEAERLAMAWWMRPMRKYRGAKLVWKTADVIWNWAGDTATDYNHYTKRALLSGVIGASMLYWVQEDDARAVEAFIDRRIDNALSLGKIAAKVKNA